MTLLTASCRQRSRASPRLFPHPGTQLDFPSQPLWCLPVAAWLSSGQWTIDGSGVGPSRSDPLRLSTCNHSFPIPHCRFGSHTLKMIGAVRWKEPESLHHWIKPGHPTDQEYPVWTLCEQEFYFFLSHHSSHRDLNWWVCSCGYFFFSFEINLFLNWRIVALQNWLGFCKRQHESAIGIHMSPPYRISLPPPAPSHPSRMLPLFRREWWPQVHWCSWSVWEAWEMEVCQLPLETDLLTCHVRAERVPFTGHFGYWAENLVS